MTVLFRGEDLFIDGEVICALSQDFVEVQWVDHFRHADHSFLDEARLVLSEGAAEGEYSV